MEPTKRYITRTAIRFLAASKDHSRDYDRVSKKFERQQKEIRTIQNGEERGKLAVRRVNIRSELPRTRDLVTESPGSRKGNVPHFKV